MSTIINERASAAARKSASTQATFRAHSPAGGGFLLVGIWLSTSPTVTGSLGDADGHIGKIVGEPPSWNPTPYVIPDLRPEENAYMYNRGKVWPPASGHTPIRENRR